MRTVAVGTAALLIGLVILALLSDPDPVAAPAARNVGTAKAPIELRGLDGAIEPPMQADPTVEDDTARIRRHVRAGDEDALLEALAALTEPEPDAGLIERLISLLAHENRAVAKAAADALAAVGEAAVAPLVETSPDLCMKRAS